MDLYSAFILLSVRITERELISDKISALLFISLNTVVGRADFLLCFNMEDFF